MSAHYEPDQNDSNEILAAKDIARRPVQEVPFVAIAYQQMIQKVLDDRSDWISMSCVMHDALSDAISLLEDHVTSQGDMATLELIKAAYEESKTLIGI